MPPPPPPQGWDRVKKVYSPTGQGNNEREVFSLDEGSGVSVVDNQMMRRVEEDC